MNKITSAILLMTLLVSGSVFSQTDGPRAWDDFLINPSWEYYSENLLSAVASGRGNTGIADFGDLSGLTLNPASVNISKKYQIYTGAVYKTGTDFPYSYNQQISNILPSCIVGGIYKINDNFQTGFVYRNDYGFTFEYGINYNSDSKVTEKFLTHSFTVPVIYKYKCLSAGVNLNLTCYSGEIEGSYSSIIYPEGSYSKSYTNLWRFVPQFGVIINPADEFSIGITYTPGFEDSVDWKKDNVSVIGIKSLAKIPWRFGIGTESRIIDGRMKFLLDYHFEKTSVLSNQTDKSNFYFGVEYNTYYNIIVRGGFFTLRDFKDYSHVIYVGEKPEYGQNFLTVGASYIYNDFLFNISLADSHLTGKSSVSHTKIAGGFSLNL